MLLPPALVPTCGPPALISCVPHGDAVSVSSLPFGSPAVILSYSIFSAEPPRSCCSDPSIASSLSPWLSPRRSYLSPSMFTCESWTRRPCCIYAVVLPHALILRHVSASLRVCPDASPFLPSSPDLLPLSSCGPLRPLAPSLALRPPALAADIARRDEDIGNQTGRVGALRSVVGGSAPRRKSPSRTCVVVGNSISRPLFLHLPHQYHPVH